jgi:hypothetical protein
MVATSFFSRFKTSLARFFHGISRGNGRATSSALPECDLFANPDIVGLKTSLLSIVGQWGCSDQELKDWDRVTAKVNRDRSDLLTAATELDVPFTQGFWRLSLGTIIYQIESVPASYLKRQSEIYYMFDAPENIEYQGGCVCDVLVLIKRICENNTAFVLENYETEIISCFISTLKIESDVNDILVWFSNALLSGGGLHSDRFDIDGWMQLAFRQKQAALATRKSGAVAFAAVVQAVVAISQADRDIVLRHAAFRYCWIAIEHIRSLDKEAKDLLEGILLDAMKSREYISILRVYLIHKFDLSAADPIVREYVGTHWPPRISDKGPGETQSWMEYFFKLQSVEFKIVIAQESLLSRPDPKSITVDWKDWRFEYAAYRRAVPHNRSLLRERHFNRIVLDLAHEVTHVLSLMGGLGAMLSVHRVQAVHAWLMLWTAASEEVTEAVIVNKGGIPQLKSDNLYLISAAIGLQAPLEKARLIEDVWTVWLEGIAVYCETASDPTGDAKSINNVMLALRNFVDVFENADKFSEAFQTHVADFEDRVSRAMQETAVDRLYMFVEARETPYLAGYLMVRGIVSSWRKTTNTPISGSKCLQLLLHATCFLSWETMPDLSEPLSVASTSIHSSFSTFLKILLTLPADDILAFTAESETSPNMFTWVDGRLRPSSRDQAESEPAIRRRIRSRLEEIQRLHARTLELVLSSNTESNDTIDEKAIASAQEMSSFAIEKAEQNLYSLLGRLSLLPVGSADAPFSLATMRVGERDVARLTVILKTTETHCDDGKPSMNAMSVPITFEDAKLIASHYSSSGEPTIRVTRVIVLDTAILEDGLHYPHLFWLEYGPWKSIEKLNLASEALLRVRDEDALEGRLRGRLSPRPIQVVEENVVANGDALMECLKSWADGLSKIPRDDSSAKLLIDYISDSASTFLASDSRKLMQRDAAKIGLVTIFGERDWVRRVVEEQFVDVVAPAARFPILKAFTTTGRAPGVSPELERWNSEISRTLPFFEKGELGWDVQAGHSNGDAKWNL